MSRRPQMLVLAVVCLAVGLVLMTGCNNRANLDAKPQVQIQEPAANTDVAKLQPSEPAPGGAPAAATPMPPVGTPANPVGVAGTTTGGRIHIAEAKDNYYRMALKYYGDGKKWQKIQDANPSVPANKIPIGAKIFIPD